VKVYSTDTESLLGGYMYSLEGSKWEEVVLMRKAHQAKESAEAASEVVTRLKMTSRVFCSESSLCMCV
jgi:hypothetical protein